MDTSSMAIAQIVGNDTTLRVLRKMVEMKRASYIHLKKDIDDASEEQLEDALEVLQKHNLIRGKEGAAPVLNTFVVTSEGLDTSHQLQRDFNVKMG